MPTDTAGLNIALLYHLDNGRPHVVREFGVYSGKAAWYIDGGRDYIGRFRMVYTTSANTAAQQAEEVLTALKAGPSFTGNYTG